MVGGVTAWNGQLWSMRGQRSRPHEVKDRFGGLVEVSLGRVAILVCAHYKD